MQRPPLLSGGPHRRSSYSVRGVPAYLWMPAVGLTGSFIYGYFACLEETPMTKRKRFIATDTEFERKLGDQEYKNLLRQYRGQILPPQHPASQTVKRVGDRISSASRVFANNYPHTNLSPSPYTYTVVRSNQANAFVLPNNHVFVLTGLFKYVKDEDELAAVLGHETAHNLARHAGERMSGGIVLNIFARLSLLVDPTGLLAQVLIPAATLLHTLPNSREAEVEADQIGVYLAAEACYDPRAAKLVFQAMKDGTGGAPPEFISTHPSHDTRISNFDQWIPGAMAIYDSDMGERCHRVREHMAQARVAAAQQASNRVFR